MGLTCRMSLPLTLVLFSSQRRAIDWASDEDKWKEGRTKSSE